MLPWKGVESASSASTGQWMGDSYPRDFSNTVLELALPASAREWLADQLPLPLLTQPSAGIPAPLSWGGVENQLLAQPL